MGSLDLVQTGKIGGLYVTDDYIDVVWGVADLARDPSERGLFPHSVSKPSRVYFRDHSAREFGEKRVAETFKTAAKWLTEKTGGVEKVGVGCFGPFDTLDQKMPVSQRISSGYGGIDSKVHTRLSGLNVYEIVLDSLSASQSRPPDVRLQTDVDVAALGELYGRYVKNGRWHDGGDKQVVAFLKFSKGVGGGVVVGKELWGGRLHPEMGQIRVERWKGKTPLEGKDETEFNGVCDHHGACLEGLASARAFFERWGLHYWEIDDLSHSAWDRQAHYAASMCVNVTCLFVPSQIVLGGSLMNKRGLVDLTKRKFFAMMGKSRKKLYPSYPDLYQDHFIDGYGHSDSKPGSGVKGALTLAAISYGEPSEVIDLL